MTVIAHEVNSQISGVLAQLMRWRGETQRDIAALLHCTGQTIGRKMRGEREWEAWEVASLATHYEVSVGVLYGGPDALFAGVTTSSFSTPVDGVSPFPTLLAA